MTALSSFGFPMCLSEEWFCQYIITEKINLLGVPERALHYNQSHYQNMFVPWKTCFTSGFSLYFRETFVSSESAKNLVDSVGTKN